MDWVQQGHEVLHCILQHLHSNGGAGALALHQAQLSLQDGLLLAGLPLRQLDWVLRPAEERGFCDVVAGEQVEEVLGRADGTGGAGHLRKGREGGKGRRRKDTDRGKREGES